MNKIAPSISLVLFLCGLFLIPVNTAYCSCTGGCPNVALNKTAYDNGNEGTYTRDKAFDGNTSTRWSSVFNDNAWIHVDLGKYFLVNSIVLNWENAYGADYKILVSNDASVWTEAAHITDGKKEIRTIPMGDRTARFVKMQGVRRGTCFGYSLWEFEVHATEAVDYPPTDITLSSSHIFEQQPVGALVGSLTSSDPNPADNYAYSLVSGYGSTDNASFSISGNKLQTAAILNYATKSTYMVRIRTTETNGQLFWYEKAFFITVYPVQGLSFNLNKFALFGADQVFVNSGSTVSNGSVGSNGPVEIGDVSTVNGDLIARGNAILHVNSTINGQVIAGGAVTTYDPVVINGAKNSGIAVGSISIPEKTVTPGSQNITVANGKALELAPGFYNNLVANANSIVRMTTGIYHFRSFQTEPGVLVSITGSPQQKTDIRVLESLDLRDLTRFQVAGNPDPAAVELYTQQSSVVNIHPSDAIIGIVWAPRAELHVHPYAKVIGSLRGKRVFLENNVKIGKAETEDSDGDRVPDQIETMYGTNPDDNSNVPALAIPTDWTNKSWSDNSICYNYGSIPGYSRSMSIPITIAQGSISGDFVPIIQPKDPSDPSAPSLSGINPPAGFVRLGKIFGINCTIAPNGETEFAFPFPDAAPSWLSGNNIRLYRHDGLAWEEVTIFSVANRAVYFRMNKHSNYVIFKGGDVICVDASVTVPGDGSDWGNAGSNPANPAAGALKDLQDAIYLSGTSGKAIWVAQGTYFPSTSNRDASFVLQPGMQILGGFAKQMQPYSITNSQSTYRDPQVLETILSGEIGNVNDKSDNSACIVKGALNAVIDGFTIRSAHGQNSPGPGFNAGGAGIQNAADNVIIKNCRIIDNFIQGIGAGICNIGNNVSVISCQIKNNTAFIGFGGGVKNEGSNFKLTNCIISNNRAGNGGGIDLSLTPPTGTIAIENCIFAYDTSDTYGGAVAFGTDTKGNIVIKNCTFYLDSARTGGGAMSTAPADLNNVIVHNSIFWDNRPDQIQPVSFWGGNPLPPTVRYSDVQNGYTGPGNISSNPSFPDPLHGNFYPRSVLVLDAADGDQAPAKDIFGVGRVDNSFPTHQGIGTPSYCDMGAVEATTVSSGYFRNSTTTVGLSAAPGYRIAVVDVNNDNYPDILVCNGSYDKQYLYLNCPKQGSTTGERTFVDYTVESKIRTSREKDISTGKYIDGHKIDGAIFGDVNNDGFVDMFVFSNNNTDQYDRNDLYINDGKWDQTTHLGGAFELSKNNFFQTETWNNGIRDYVIGEKTLAAAFFDYTLDGKLDIYMGGRAYREVVSSQTEDVPGDQVYEGTGLNTETDKPFNNITYQIPQIYNMTIHYSQTSYSYNAEKSWLHGVTMTDWNNDRKLDILTSAYGIYGVSRLWQNNGNRSFTEKQVETGFGLHTGANTEGVADGNGSYPRDFDNNGDMDVLEVIIHGAEGVDAMKNPNPRTCLLVNQGESLGHSFLWDFDRIADRNLLSNDPNSGHHRDVYAAWFDVDNDGWADFALTDKDQNSNVERYSQLMIFMQKSDHKFYCLSNAMGFQDVNNERPDFNGVIAFDYDNDGDEDLLVSYGIENELQLWENMAIANTGSGVQKRNSNNWVKIKIEGKGTGSGSANRSGIGARVYVTTDTREYMQEVTGGNGHAGPQVPFMLHFGIGTDDHVNKITVLWPNNIQGSTVISQTKAANKGYLVKESDNSIQEIAF
jgi:hypothetical protein